jgi:hypothetical protein
MSSPTLGAKRMAMARRFRSGVADDVTGAIVARVRRQRAPYFVLLATKAGAS